MKTHFIILNGPPGSGKTLIARELCRAFTSANVSAQIDSFAAPMKHFIATALGEQYHALNKERIYPELNGYTPRQFLISLAEDYLKKEYGQDIFGRWLIHRTLRFPNRKLAYCIIDDGGFKPEIMALPNRVLIHVRRDDKTFTNDSRGYVDNPWSVFYNNEDMTSLFANVELIAHQIRLYVS